MKLLLGIYDHGEVMHVMLYRGVTVIADLLPFDCLNFNDFSVLSHN